MKEGVATGQKTLQLLFNMGTGCQRSPSKQKQKLSFFKHENNQEGAATSLQTNHLLARTEG